MVDLLIKGGTVVNHDDEKRLDVLVDKGVIIKVAENIDVPAKEIYDASGKYVFPGAIDSHTHMSLPFGGTYSSDTYYSGGEAALAGGVTSYIDYATQEKGESIVASVNRRREIVKKEKPRADVFFHCAVTDFRDGKTLEEFKDLAKNDIHSLKCYMVYRKAGLMMTPEQIEKILIAGKKNHVMINVHAENNDMLEANVDRFLSEGKTSAWYHYLSRDEEVEFSGDKIIVDLAVKNNCPVYIVHLANKKGVELVRQRKSEGYEIYAETCPQYLAFTSDVYKNGERAVDYVCSPAIKGKDSQEELWRAIIDGTIDTVATDHCPFFHYEKMWGIDDFSRIPNGCGGIQYLFTYLLSEASKRSIPLSRIATLVSYNPSRIFGLEKKGEIKEGKDADIVIVDMKEKTIIDKIHDLSKADTNIYDKMILNCKISKVFKK